MREYVVLETYRGLDIEKHLLGVSLLKVQTGSYIGVKIHNLGPDLSLIWNAAGASYTGTA